MVQQLISAVVRPHSSLALLLITSVLISRLTVPLQGRKKACVCDFQSCNQNSYYAIMNYDDSMAVFSFVALTAKLSFLILPNETPAQRRVLFSAESGAAAQHLESPKRRFATMDKSNKMPYL